MGSEMCIRDRVIADQVGTSFVGQKKKVVGIFRSNIEENKDGK